MDPSRWIFDRDLHRQVIPAEHPELLGALTRLWESEVGRNCQAAALSMGVDAALKMAMGGAITFVIVNEDFSKFQTRTPRTSDLLVAGADTNLDEVARAMEGLRERRNRTTGPGPH